MVSNASGNNIEVITWASSVLRGDLEVGDGKLSLCWANGGGKTATEKYIRNAQDRRRGSYQRQHRF
jgi:hypothetical protein